MKDLRFCWPFCFTDPKVLKVQGFRMLRMGGGGGGASQFAEPKPKRPRTLNPKP